MLHDYNKALCVHDYQPVNGRMTVPELPGIGNEWTPEAMRDAETVTVY